MIILVDVLSTPHRMWNGYQERGVKTTAILVLRDRTIGTIVARLLVHCPAYTKLSKPGRNVGVAYHEGGHDALCNATFPVIAIVSYETMVHMGALYLNLILNQLQQEINMKSWIGFLRTVTNDTSNPVSK